MLQPSHSTIPFQKTPNQPYCETAENLVLTGLQSELIIPIEHIKSSVNIYSRERGRESSRRTEKEVKEMITMLFIIQVGENNIKEFRAHSIVLRARSPYFKTSHSVNWITRENNMFIFNKLNVTPIVYEMILKYIYTGELDPIRDDLSIEEIIVWDYLIKWGIEQTPVLKVIRQSGMKRIIKH
ncbi:hypothetical protein GLOIN_2v1487449 [Rhizophagus irregularis DAOM 181602=DAOM 197198]|uniref:BTB domain-containing protein n=2 Tax=Rhizophagus irregularis (strain DAOM 181602 / DAOM 197198 / MUCL 43194) TaxID=747089 RepID=A0A2P4P3F3_RHIID|nr:hypothetical protein GLOIN_2v1487449 [Rhizophagus irregularis DAOM 181602=DAOM 197198]POG59898.1 hypothetical protein GLOIN_2v1487449 [Rhizophagus irregularis DAOM 181602=DAOM 197198]|eukprot:XP_025166764.1 hypothetical protein GLOIN_2v1487449 [Rhizophagus irregularis DAOM 181602=DAOM 197198]